MPDGGVMATTGEPDQTAAGQPHEGIEHGSQQGQRTACNARH